VVRAVGVAIHMDSVRADEFAAGVEGRFNLGRRRSTIQTSEENLVIAGTVDTIHAKHTPSGSEVTLVGRDNRGILLDMPIHPNILKDLDLRKPLNEVVARLVHDLHPQGEGIKVVVVRNEWPNFTVPSPYVTGDLTRPNIEAKGGTGSPNSSTKGEAGGVNYWDLITQWCFLCGAVPYFVGSKLHLRRARSLYDARRQEQTADPNFPTPFAGGERRAVGPPTVQVAETPWAFRRLVYGRDIENLEFERKLGGTKVPVIEVVSVDTDGPKGEQRLVSVQYPPESATAARTTSIGPSGDKASTQTLRIPVAGIKSKDRLLQIAAALHAEIGRQEMGGSVSTKYLSSFGGDNQDPDLLRLRPGDPVEFRMDTSSLRSFPPIISELTDHHRRSFEVEVAEVAAKLGDENLARVLVASSRGALQQLQETFRVSTVRFAWDTKAGVGITFDFQNFVEVRYGDPSEKTTPTTKPPVAPNNQDNFDAALPTDVTSEDLEM
jgi:hypothetical protein